MLRTLMLMLVLAVLTASAARAADDPLLMPLGHFVSADSDGVDHAYGHAFELWHHGDRLVGAVQHWHAAIEGNGGEFTSGHYNPLTGTLSFQVSVRRNGSPDERDTATFSGRLHADRITGTLVWGKGTFAASQRELLNLPLDREQVPVPLRLSAWRSSGTQHSLSSTDSCAAFDRAGRSAAVSSRVGPGAIELQAKVMRRGRLPFHSGPAAHCKTKLFIIHGDRVSVGVPFNGYRPITYVAGDGKVHRSWVEEDALDIQPFQFE